MHKTLRYLKVDGKVYGKEEIVDLSVLKKSEVVRLEKKGFIEKVNGNPIPESVESEAPGIDEGDGELPGSIETNETDGEQLTDAEIKEELLEKLNHGIVVKELKVLGAEFKANASFEKLVELIMENEDYENHFLDYIDDNEL